MADDKNNGWVFDLEEDADLPELDGAPKAKKPAAEAKKEDPEAGDASTSPALGVSDTVSPADAAPPVVEAADEVAPHDVPTPQPPVYEPEPEPEPAAEPVVMAPPPVAPPSPPRADRVAPPSLAEQEPDMAPADLEDILAKPAQPKKGVETPPPPVADALDDYGLGDEVYAEPTLETPSFNAKRPMTAESPTLIDSDLPELMLQKTVAGGGNEKLAAELADDGAYADRPEHEKEFYRVLKVLSMADDLNIDTLAVARIRDLLNTDRLPQLIVKDLVTEKLIERDQLARAIARSKGRLELTTIQDLPEGARNLRKDFDSRAQVLMRDRRIIPIRVRATDRGESELHMAHATGTRDLIVEAQLNDIIPGYTYIWHYASRDVCGQYWLSGDEGTDVDEGMEAEALLDRIISTAIDARASDIHIDPSIKGDPKATIKYRIDGFAQPREIITQEQLERLRVRIENVARMPKVNLNHPNKGAFTRSGFDWRVQIQPHAGRQGPVPRIVIRRLNPDTMSLERLGYPKYFIQKLISAAKAPNGVIFWTGPTGSGKTESIHSAVISANPMARGKSVHTIEDPPEKRVEGYAVQMEIAEGDPARTALQLLKSSLRADPDVVIFGEVRDSEMAKLVFEAANTGHLVFSTLHTNTSIDALVRLEELGVEGFMLSYIRGIAAQRLARRLCTQCRVPMNVPDDMTRYVFDLYGIPMEGANLYTHHRGGCPNCNFTGYKGRIAVAEWLEPTVEMIEACTKGQYARIAEIARRGGWKPMGHMGALHIKDGITDVHELQDVIVELAMAG
jgi:type II secretory ATPase GspE/PulE/Tfp pilus assembly ATPase PilB-like protein